ncbi:UNVERIFIED_CONTAM: Aspartic proteinase CDR1 [Sesamum angustifolium]|uniref:Aspartic proteinase CDR1 n=1 Tax=Sesamum angustifolium TaxID=2727405 RepID=A0AAW2MB24_9LAMI
MAFHYKPLSLFLLPLLLSCFASVFLIPLIQATKNGGITVDLIHRDSPLSPAYNPSHTRFERLRSAFNRSFSRKSSLRLTSASKSPESFQGTLTPIGGEYLLKVKIGTPPVEQLGIADTGSDLTWTQCQPCTQCYKQNIPLFDPRKTKTYRRVSCQSDQCNAVGSASCDSRNACQYQVSYGDRSYSIGDLAVETFTFVTPSSRDVCRLNPGQEITDTFYFLTLEGVSVGRERLQYTSSNTDAALANEGNIIIDSGTTLTFLPSELYQELESTLERTIEGKRATDSQGVFNLCYELPSDGQFKSPPIVAHFKGADLVLTEGSTFVEVEKGVVCLTLVPSQDLAIFGNLHQMNYKIGMIL